MENQEKPNKINYNHITEEENKIIEENKVLKENKVDYLFIMKNYGKCNSFILEIVQTEGITMYEHQKLKEIIKVKSKFKVFDTIILNLKFLLKFIYNYNKV